MRKIIALPAFAVALAACSSSPTAAPAADVQPRFDGGVFGGSGNVVTPPPAPTYTTTATTTGAVVMADSGTSRGGVFGGSGN